jgi:hypothetical protein
MIFHSHTICQRSVKCCPILEVLYNVQCTYIRTYTIPPFYRRVWHIIKIQRHNVRKYIAKRVTAMCAMALVPKIILNACGECVNTICEM